MDEARKKFCKHCGEQIDFDCVICPKCGKQVEELKSEAPQVVINNSNSNANVNTNVNGGIGYPLRKKWTAFFLCLFLGWLGIHRFYVWKTGTGILWFFTLGLCGIGWVVDLILILIGGFRDKYGRPLI